MRRPDGSGTLDMDLAAPGGIGSEHTLTTDAHIANCVDRPGGTRDLAYSRGNSPSHRRSSFARTSHPRAGIPNQFKVHVPSNPELLRILEANPQVNLHVRVKSGQQLVMTGQVLRPEPIQIVLRNEGFNLMTSRLAPVVEKVSPSPLPPLLQAVSQVNAYQVSQALTSNHLDVDRRLFSAASSANQESAKLPSELAKSVVRSIQTVGAINRC